MYINIYMDILSLMIGRLLKNIKHHNTKDYNSKSPEISKKNKSSTKNRDSTLHNVMVDINLVCSDLS